ncbi:MAG: hypothetical protein M1824_003571 [Vezdaea acicularis]|nr:MAG: hypothetical protein M1824_003571 [Vezdaea acicularis]
MDAWGKERTAYERLRSMQGKELPFMYAAMVIDAPGKPSDIISLPCGALLLEYIDGQSLEDVAQHLPPSEFHKVYQATLGTLHRIARLGVINHDAVARDWLLRKDAGSGYQPVQVDFGQAQMRGHEDLQEWLKIAYWSNQEDRIFLGIEHLYACRYLLPNHDYHRFYQIHPAPMDELMFDVDSMVLSDRTELTSTLRGCVHAISPTSSTVHDGFTSCDSIMRLCSPAASSTPDGSISDEVGMPTPPDSLYNCSENKARLRSQSLPASLSSWTHDACAWEKNLKLSLSPNEIDYARHSILDWRQANTILHFNENEVTENGHITTIGLTEEIPFPGQSHTRDHPRVMSSCRITNDSINEGAKATTHVMRPNDQTYHHEHVKALKAKNG